MNMKEEITMLRKDKTRLDWLETQDCWIGLYGEYDIGCRWAAGGGYTQSIREVCDENMPKTVE